MVSNRLTARQHDGKRGSGRPSVGISEPSFHALRRDRVSDQIVTQVREAITKNKYHVGQKLPSENELASRFAISRTSVREALRILEALGLVDIRTGSGAFVAEPPLRRELLSDKLRWLLDRHEAILNLLDVREVLQGLAARLCALRGTEPQLAQLEAAVAQMRAAKDRGDLDAATEADARFHFFLGDFCGNDILSDLIRHFEETYRSSSRALMDLRGRILTSVGEHRRVLTAIMARDERAAEAAMRTHVRSVRRDLAGLVGRGKER
jgi:GntR family transcriptional repressor for pyruvate dehydrogenase complex